MAQHQDGSIQQRVLPQTIEGMGGRSQLPEAAAEESYYSQNISSSSPNSQSQSRADATTISQAQAPTYRLRGKHTLQILSMYGIKVRDFAYESTLPPIRPVHPRQFQPAVQHLKRQRGDEAESQESNQLQVKKSKLERRSTEPVLQSSGAVPTRTRGLIDLNDYDPAIDFHIFGSQQTGCESTPNSQLPPRYFDSQEAEPYIDTPLVTPNGSLQWKSGDRDATPPPQLEAISQEALPGGLSSSLSFIPRTLSTEEAPLRDKTPTPSSLLPISPVQIDFTTQHLLPPVSKRSSAALSPLSGPSITDPPQEKGLSIPPPKLHTRYQLRTRTVRSSSPSRSPTPSSRARSLRSHATTKPGAKSIAAPGKPSGTKSRTKKGSHSAASARTLQKKTAISSPTINNS